MGIPGLWEILGDGEAIDIAAFASDHFLRTKRPLRIAIDEACWRFNYYLKPEEVAKIRRACPPANPNEKQIFWRVLQLMRLNCQLVFVFDGLKRPCKRGRIPRIRPAHETVLYKEMLEKLGIPIHTAPAEAEAECAELYKLGIVDAVWSDDGDCLMFDAGTVIRFFWKETWNKDIEKVRIYRTSDIIKKFPQLDREGLVLFAVLSGGDYDKAGLPGCGPKRVIEAAQHGLGKKLCEVSGNSLSEWREHLIQYFSRIGDKIAIPANFPNAAHIQNYKVPMVSETADFVHIKKRWETPLDERSLWRFLGDRFNIWGKEFVTRIIPILLVRSLAQTKQGQEGSNACYQIELVKHGKSAQSTITFLFSALTAETSMFVDDWLQCAGNGYFLPNDGRVTCEKVLDCILEYAVPSVAQHWSMPRNTNRREPEAGTGKKRKKAFDQIQNTTTNEDMASSTKVGKKLGRPPKKPKPDAGNEKGFMIKTARKPSSKPLDREIQQVEQCTAVESTQLPQQTLPPLSKFKKFDFDDSDDEEDMFSGKQQAASMALNPVTHDTPRTAMRRTLSHSSTEPPKQQTKSSRKPKVVIDLT